MLPGRMRICTRPLLRRWASAMSSGVGGASSAPASGGRGGKLVSTFPDRTCTLKCLSGVTACEIGVDPFDQLGRDRKHRSGRRRGPWRAPHRTSAECREDVICVEELLDLGDHRAAIGLGCGRRLSAAIARNCGRDQRRGGDEQVSYACRRPPDPVVTNLKQWTARKRARFRQNGAKIRSTKIVVSRRRLAGARGRPYSSRPTAMVRGNDGISMRS